MAYNLSTLRANLLDKLDDPGFSSTSANQFINDSHREVLNSTRFRFTESTVDLVSSVGVQTLTGLPANLQDIIDLRVITPTNFARVLTYMTYEDFDKRYPNPALISNNPPIIYYFFNNTINIYPTPDAAYTMTLRYIRKPVSLVADVDVPDVPEEFQEVITLGAYRRALEKNNDNDIAQIIAGEYKDQLQNMLDRFANVQLSQPQRMQTRRTLRTSGTPRAF